MNEITINNRVLPIREYNGQRVVTFKDIDTVHERPDGTAGRNFRQNREHFIECVDYFKISPDEFRRSIGEMDTRQQNDITLITESGYLMLVKSFTDDLAWQVQRELVNCYFRVKREENEENKVYKPTRPLTTDDYEEAARTIAKCHNSRLPIVIDLYRKAGLDIEQTTVNIETKEIGNDASELIELLNKFTLTELCRLLTICKSSIYYYRTGEHIPRPERCEEIIRILRGR